jgi:hypothetical protein
MPTTTRAYDTRAFGVICGLALISVVVQSLTKQAEIARLGAAVSGAETWLLEITSHATVVGQWRHHPVQPALSRRTQRACAHHLEARDNRQAEIERTVRFDVRRLISEIAS